MTSKKPIQLWHLGMVLVLASALIAFGYSQSKTTNDSKGGIPKISGKWNTSFEMNDSKRQLVNGTMNLIQTGQKLDGDFIFQGEELKYPLHGFITPDRLEFEISFDEEKKHRMDLPFLVR